MNYDDWKSTDPADERTATGPRPDGDDVPNLRGSACDMCGLTIHRVYTLADVGAFCSPKCRAKATAPAQSEVA
jgi:hypothetical protein